MFLHALVFAAASNGVVDTFLSRISDNGVPERQSRTITVGALPPGWNSSVPLPPGVTVLGSVLTPKISTEIYYEPADAAKTLQSYLLQLRAAGFSNKLGMLGRSGFAFTLRAATVAMMCRAHEGVLITQPAHDDLRVTIQDPSTPGLCEPQSHQPISPLPDLIPPPGAQIVAGSGGGGTSFGAVGISSVSSSAAIESPASLAQLFTSFASQMTAANWQTQHAFVTPQGGVQTFRYHARATDWRATLLIVPSTKPHIYDARIEATGAPQTPQPAAVSPLRPAPQLHPSELPAALQLVQSIVSQYGPNGTQPALYVRSLPPDLDKRLPLPGAQLIGSLRGSDQTTLYYRVTRAAYNAYLARLQNAGWNPLHSGPPHIGGFATQFDNYTTFCKDGLPVLNVAVRPNSNDVAIMPGTIVSKCAAGAPPFAPSPLEAPPLP
jgi:hypothetical protein